MPNWLKTVFGLVTALWRWTRPARRIVAAIAVVWIAVAKMSCGHGPYPQAAGPLDKPDTYVVQVNDLGQFWDPAAAAKALQAITASVQETNCVVVVYVHGWHHNASVSDSDATQFATVLSTIRETLKGEAYARSRAALTNDSRVRVIGLYVGWRGRSLAMPFDYATFWTRKAAAERVGRGDLRKFLLRLQYLYEARNTKSPSATPQPFMGLVAIGHSFGGQALFRAVEYPLENELVKATMPNPAPAAEPRTSDLSGFGDLVLLLNPALEALQYQTIHDLDRQLTYSPRQAPVMLVLSAPNDSARLFWFPLGRTLYTLFGPSLTFEQYRLSTQALGAFEPQRTHDISVLDDVPRPTAFDPAWYLERPCDILNYDLSNVPTIAGLKLAPTATRHPYSPFLVAHIDATVMMGHSGIFRDALARFLVDYTAITEGKRILARYYDAKKCASPTPDHR